MVSVIVAVAQNGVIGGNNSLLWHIGEDLRHFKSITTGHPVIMGRKTFESLGRPLPNRENVVITRSDIAIEGCRIAHSLDEALAPYTPADSPFIIGGAEIYRAAMPLAERFYLTRIHRNYEGDTLYPEWSRNEWAKVSEERFERGEKYEYPYTFEEYRRVAKSGSEYHISQATPADIELIREIAIPSFCDTYKEIISREQNDWMLEDMYSVASLQQQMAEGHIFYILYVDGEASGYVSIERRDEHLIHLHRLYLSSALKGKGYGRIVIEHAFNEARRLCGGACRLELDVNRNNCATEFYFHLGFTIASEGDYTIPNTTFVRPDYLLAIEL